MVEVINWFTRSGSSSYVIPLIWLQEGSVLSVNPQTYNIYPHQYIDEGKVGTHCFSDSIIHTNTLRSFECTGLPGYHGDVYTCTRTYVNVFIPGWIETVYCTQYAVTVYDTYIYTTDSFLMAHKSFPSENTATVAEPLQLDAYSSMHVVCHNIWMCQWIICTTALNYGEGDEPSLFL